MTDIATTASPARSIVFIDSRVQDAATLLQGLKPGTEVVFLQAGQDGLAQMAAALGEMGDVGAVQVIAHGSAGQLWLGSRFLDNTTLQQPEVQAMLAALGRGLTADGDLLVYACNTAQGSEGAQFVSTLAALTGADVAASDDRTGAGGDWELEISTGHIAGPVALLQDVLAGYDLALATLTVTSNADVGAGSLRAAIAAATAGDTITFITPMTIGLSTKAVGDSLLILNKNLTIDGDWDNDGTADVTLDGQYKGRVLEVTTGTTAVLDGLVITKGLLAGNGGDAREGVASSAADALGAGILNSGTLTVVNSTISANVATGGGGGGAGVGGAGGGGSGFNGIGGGAGGKQIYNYNNPGAPGGMGIGGGGAADTPPPSGSTGGSAGSGPYVTRLGGNGGTSTDGGLGGLGYAYYSAPAGGKGGKVTGAGGGGGGGSFNQGNATYIGGNGGTAAGAVHITSSGILFLANSTLSGNLGAGGGGGAGGLYGTPGAGGQGIGAIYNLGQLHYNAGTTTFTDNEGGGGTAGNGGATAAGEADRAGNAASSTTWTNDTAPPTVTSVNSSTPNGTYKVGDVISIQVNFSENVVVAGGTPQLILETGGTDRAIDYTSGTGSSTLTFTYLVQAGDTTADLDYTAINALALNGSTLRDAAGNNAIRTLASPGAANSLGANKAIVIDGVAPTVTSVTAITANGTYKVDDVISIQVNFSEAVTVTGTPQLTLETGTTDQVVNYTSGSGTSTLTFTYTVQAGDTTADLDYLSTSALALNGGTIRDAASNNAVLTLPAPGAANSLGNNKAIVIDTTAPAAPSTPDLASASDSGISSTDNITNATTPTFTGTAESGSTVRLYDTDGITVLGSAVATGGSWAIPSSNLSQGTHIVTARATDAAGNVGDASTGLSVTIDTLAPAAPSAPDLASASDTGVSNSDNITTDTTPTVSGTAEAGATVTLYDTDGTTVLGTGIATGGNWSITSSALAAGTHTLTTKASDAAGNVSGASAGLAVTIVTASPPTISNLNGDSVGWAGVGNTVTLDSGGNAVLGDAEFGALNSGSGDWSGASLTVQRAGTAVAVDTLGVNTWGSLFTASGSASSGNLQSGGLTFATYTHTGGVLTINFTSSGTAATTELVNDVARHITYRNDTPAGDATLRYTLSDGTASATADVAVASDTIYVTSATDTDTIDPSNGVSFSEALAMAAADVTGSQTIVIASNLAGQTLSVAYAPALNENLTLDLSAANGVALVGGGTLNVAAGTALTVVNGAGNTATLGLELAGMGALVKSGAGALTLSGNTWLTSPTTVAAGTLLVNGMHSTHVIVASGSTLGGSGSVVGNVTVSSGGTLSPDSGTGTGVLTIDGNLDMQAGSTLAVQINGTTAGTGHDQVIVNGTVNVSGAALSVVHGYVPGQGDSYALIANDAADAVTGTFSGIAQGGTLTAGGNGTVLTASYVGGTGNDLTLTTPVNAAPVVTTSGGTAAFVEGANIAGTPVAVDSGITLSDADNTALASATVAITGNFQSGEDLLALTSNPASMGNITASYDSATGVLTLSSAGASATLAQWQAALRSVTYTNSSETPNTASRTLSFTVNDGTSNSSAATRGVTVTAVNDAPVAVADSLTVAEGGTATTLVSGATSVLANDTDGEASTLVSVLVTGPAHGSLTLNANGTFSYVHNGSDTTTDSFSYKPNDGTADGNTVSVAITVTPVNDAPANTVPGAQVITEDNALVFSVGNGNALAISDVDAGGSPLEVNLSVTNGTLTLAGTTGLSFTTGDGTADSMLVFSGTLVDINNALAGLAYTPTANYHGAAVLSLVTSDLGHTGSGGALTDTDSVNITVTPSNDAPTVANPIPNQNATEDAAFNFQFAVDAFADVDVGDTLTYTAQLSGGGALPSWLSFDPVTRTFSGTPLNAHVGTVSIDVIASDGNGGTVTDTFDVVVANTNDAPTVANAIPDHNATIGAPFSFAFSANTFADMDLGDTLTYIARVAGGGALPSWLSFDAATRTFSGTPANGDKGTLSIEVIADDGNGGTVTDSFDVVVAAAPVVPAPEEPTPPTPPVVPGIPDNDGVPNVIEDQAPGIPGPDGTTMDGDGNGDGIKDSQQPSVGSISFLLSPTAESNPGNAPPTFTTLVASSQNGKVGSGNDNSRILSLSQKDAPADVPQGMEMPIGLISFTVELGQGKSGENFSLYLDPALGVNGYWKQDASGTWVNIASEPYGGKTVMEGGKLRLDFHIEDGGQFDADGKVDGIITDPGAPAHMPLSITGMAPDLPQGFWF